MADQVETVNKALIFLGQDPITDIDDDVKGAILAKRIWATTRDSTLRAALWNFARVQVNLPLTTTTPIADWAYEFDLPADYIRMVRVVYDIPYEIMSKKLLADYNEVKCTYVRQVTGVGDFDPLFVDTLAARLAHDLAIPLTANRSLMGDAWDLYLKKRSEARTVNSQDTTPMDIIDDEWDSSRVSYRTGSGRGSRRGYWTR